MTTIRVFKRFGLRQLKFKNLVVDFQNKLTFTIDLNGLRYFSLLVFFGEEFTLYLRFSILNNQFEYAVKRINF